MKHRSVASFTLNFPHSVLQRQSYLNGTCNIGPTSQSVNSGACKDFLTDPNNHGTCGNDVNILITINEAIVKIGHCLQSLQFGYPECEYGVCAGTTKTSE